MQFPIAIAVVILSIAAPFTFGQNLDNNNNNNNLQVARNEFDSVELDIRDVELDEANFLAIRDTKHCNNQGKIKRVKKEYKGKCNPDNSIGFQSAHNCKDSRQGKSYLCVQGKKATCYTAAEAKTKNFENGECFLRK